MTAEIVLHDHPDGTDYRVVVSHTTTPRGLSIFFLETTGAAEVATYEGVSSLDRKSRSRQT